MKKILIKISDNNLIFKERTKLNAEHKSLINTNVISCNELVFSDDYFIVNQKIVSNFILELCNDYHTDTVVIECNDYILTIISTLNNNPHIKNLIIKTDTQLTFKMCEAITKTHIKNINCYSIQPFMIEYFDKHDCLVESRNEILFFSKFMINNNLSLFSSLFYKMSVIIDLPMDEQDLEDFQAFCKINKYLKVIHVNKVNKSDLENIVSILRSCNKKNIKIIIHNNINDEEAIKYLVSFNKNKRKRYKIRFKIDYSDKYLQDNILKETNNSILRSCGLILIFIVIITFGYVFYDNFSSIKKDEEMQQEIIAIINNTEPEKIQKTIEKIETKVNTEVKREIINEDLVSLYDKNPSTVAWITVPGTKIDYPITQSNDNVYYLKHNFNYEYDKNGWVFMDYRNTLEPLSSNIIVYAHNRYSSGIMFGTLQNTQRSSWYKNPDNYILKLRTFYDNYEYKVFSVYKILVTSDYLQTKFRDSNEKMEFLNMLKDRSIYDFGVELKPEDKIITLSTCAADNHRNVLHAVLINKSQS